MSTSAQRNEAMVPLEEPWFCGSFARYDEQQRQQTCLHGQPATDKTPSVGEETMNAVEMQPDFTASASATDTDSAPQDNTDHSTSTPLIIDVTPLSLDDGVIEVPPIVVPMLATKFPILTLDMSFDTPVNTFETPSQRRRRERRGIALTNPSTAVAESSVSIDVVEKPTSRIRSRRRSSPNRRRDGEIDIIDESDEAPDAVFDCRGRQRKRPSELRCFAVQSKPHGPKRAYPAQTPVSPVGSMPFDFRRMPASPSKPKNLGSLKTAMVASNCAPLEFVSTPISPVAEIW